ncbi:MAG: hypothetical protein Kow0081_1190 [Candidatus Dojkabacteria bacterium]
MKNFDELKNKLNAKNIKYKFLPVSSQSVDETVAQLGIKYREGLSTIVFSINGGERFVAVLRRDDRNINNRELKKLLNTDRVTFASEEEQSKLGFEHGLVTPVLLADRNIEIIADSKFLEMDKVVCGSANPNFALEITKEELLKVIGEYTTANVTEPNKNRQDKEHKRILTGDRPTGKLHIGHYVGSLKNRVALQEEYETYILIANIHALSDNRDNPEKVKNSIFELLCDYYAVGLDFSKTTIYIQSEVPEVHEIFMYLSNFASLQQLMHNPTLKTEIKQNRMEESTPLGFFIYPVHQAADILCVNADLVPVGRDQAPMIEDTRELARKFNATYAKKVLNEPRALFGTERNLPGTDGNAKMGKSLNNFISLSETEEDLRKKIFSVYTDPNRIKATDPGKIEGNVAFAYHDAFNENKDEVNELKERYRKGLVGDVEVKEKLFFAMNKILKPIRERRHEAEKKKEELFEQALEGSKKVRKIARGIADQMKEAMQINFD